MLDKTLTLDPAELWSDPADCPDWPLSLDMLGRVVPVGRSREEAAERLRQIHHMLHDGATTQAPTEAERADMHARYFQPGALVNRRWDALGLTGTAPASPAVSEAAQVIVEAVHIRGYLRKLDSAAETERARTEANRLEALRRRVDGAPETLRRLEEQLAEAEEGEARYKKWLADQHAAARAAELRDQIDGVRAEAAQARASLARDDAA